MLKNTKVKLFYSYYQERIQDFSEGGAVSGVNKGGYWGYLPPPLESQG